MPRTKPKSPQDELAEINIAIAKAKLAKLEGELPPAPTPEYTSWKDLPPLKPEEREELEAYFIDLLTVDAEEEKRKKHDWYMSMAHLAP